ncbi:S53 family peptidase [Amycolatopsis sp. NEAU-NG30]|uniref:S53 family peptidase n=1 Tax=Amycolatopsis melonis TaxID=3156488 RepID=A0ABV0LSQ8_9PSEU
MRTPAFRLLVLATTAVTTAGLLFGAPASASDRTPLPGSVPGWAKSATRAGAANAADNVAFRVYLGWAGDAAAVASRVSTPGSADYGRFLTAAQFRQRFAPSQNDVTAVQQWLRQAGFDVGYTPGNRRYVQAEGTVAQAAAAFGTSFGEFKVGGKTLRAPEKELSLPAGLPAGISAVVGLDESFALVQPSAGPAASPSPAFVNAPPCSAYYGEKSTATTPTPDGIHVPDAYGHPNPWAPCGYTPSQLRSAYGVQQAIAGGNDGTGQTVAIIDAYASPTILADVNTYSSRHGLPQLSGNQLTQVTPPGVYRRPQNPKQDPQGWYGEETLDVEAVHSIAPGANIVYVGSPNNYQDLDAAMNHVVDQHLASIVTNSYGFSTELLPTGYVKPFNDTLIEAAATGIGVYFSSGDNADETDGIAANYPNATPDWPASSPWVTAVGGTSLGVGAGGEYLFETGWETGRSVLTNGTWVPAPPGEFFGGAGGGTSRLFPQPAYQAGVVPNAIATANGARPQPMRAVPDVAALADPNTGFLVGQTQAFPDGSVRYSEYRIGGTSLASPLFAAFVALAQQRAGSTFGFANPRLYAKAGTSAFHDVRQPPAPMAVARVNYNNSVDASAGYSAPSLRSLDADAVLTIHVRDGYDDVTGIGTPNGTAFLTALG